MEAISDYMGLFDNFFLLAYTLLYQWFYWC